MSRFEKKLDTLFDEAIDTIDTVWYSNTETLRDAIMRIYNEEHDEPLLDVKYDHTK